MSVGQGARGRRQRVLPPNAKNRWVSKTAFRLYLRCPYAFFQIDSGRVPREAMIDVLGEQLIEEGIVFEQTVVSTAAPPAPDVDFRKALTGDIPLYGLPLLRNERLKILGIPDGIDPAGGVLVPIEIKSHEDVQRPDLWGPAGSLLAHAPA